MGNTARGNYEVSRGPWHVAVLMGGWSAEREVSLMSGNGVADALESRGHKVTRIDMDRNVAQVIAGGIFGPSPVQSRGVKVPSATWKIVPCSPTCARTSARWR